MFETERTTVDKLLATDEAFRRLYHKHATLNARVDEVTAGDAPMTPLELECMKKEKLLLADRMHDILRDYRAHH